MSSARRVNVVATALLLISLVGGVTTLYAIDHVEVRAFPQEALYIRSSLVLRRMCLGYTGLLADIYWTRAVQYFGSQHHRGSGDFRLLAPLLQVTTELDPHIIPPYEFGANFLAQKQPYGAGLPGEALALLKYGVANNPDKWRLYYNLGFLYFTEFKDYANAANAFTRGAQLPVTNNFMPILAARMAQHAGEFDTARVLWYTAYQNTKEPQIKQNATDHLLALQVDEDVTRLEEVVAKYRQKTGRLPSSMGDLDAAGFIHGTPQDPNGHPYMLKPDGRIEVQNPESILYITKGLPPGMESPMPKATTTPTAQKPQN
jgi:tetratricopeptide (TPR) repeat protein